MGNIISKLGDAYGENKFIDIPKISHANMANEINKVRNKYGICCPHCDCKSIVRYGRYKGIQRYKCKECGSTFNDFSFTPMNKSHYDNNKWALFIECMIHGYSLRKSSKILKISFVSLFYWRHKILDSLKQADPKKFKGIVEMDDIYFAYSEKGKKHIEDRLPRKRGYKYKYICQANGEGTSVCVFSVVDRRSNIISKVSCIGKIYAQKIDAIVGKNICRDNILCTDSWRAYINYARKRRIEHHIINSFFVTKKYNIENVKNYDNKFEIWLKRFSGVASKYLNNYLTWFKYIIGIDFKVTFNNVKNMLIMSCANKMCETYNSIRLSEFSI